MNTKGFDILKVDFEWVKETNNVKELKQALTALKAEGGYTALEEAVQQKIQELDPKSWFLCRVLTQNVVSEEERKVLEQELDNWQQTIEKQDKDIAAGDKSATQKRRAEQEKETGNDYMKSKDYKQAIEAYSKAETLDKTNAAVYCNRALARLKLKQYELTIEDCGKALALDPNYVKAFLRRAKARMELKQYKEAIPDLESVLESNNSPEINKDLKTCRDFLKQYGGFKKINIIEEEEEIAEIAEKHPKVVELFEESSQESPQEPKRPKVEEIFDEEEKEQAYKRAPSLSAIVQKATESLSVVSFPRTAFDFELAASGFKQSPPAFCTYLRVLAS